MKLAADQVGLQVEFHDEHCRESPFYSRESHRIAWHLKAWNVITEHKISLGDEIILETADLEALPLPDVNLLDMHSVLQRLLALSGSAEPSDDHHNDDEDDDDHE
ncbi:hypothetical protein RJZ90_003082 [Blastomyces dermatitidis]